MATDVVFVSKGGLPTAKACFKKHKIREGETVAQSLKDRFDYGQNPAKTQGSELIPSYECDHMTADVEFLLYKAKYGQYDVHTILRNKQSNAWFEKRQEQYCILIREIFDEFRQILGTKKIRTILVQRDHQVSKEYVPKLMKETGMASI